MQMPNYFRWTTVPWSFFFDLEPLLAKVRIAWRVDLSFEWMYDNLGIGKNDIYFIRDMTPYDYGIYDEPESQTPLTRFLNRIDLATLEAVQEPVLHFGSVFGTGRVLAQTEEHAELLRYFRTHMVLRNSVLMDTAARIVEQLGGIGQFVGIHYRSGDGLFRQRAGLNLDDIYHQLVDSFTDLTVAQVADLEQGKHDEDRKEDTAYEVRQLRKFDAAENVQKPIEVNHPEQDVLAANMGEKPANLRLACSAPTADNERFQKTVIYLATDTPSPRTSPLLQKIYATFPCVFDLSDFQSVLADVKRVMNVEEKVKLDSYLIPMLDAMIAAQGHTFMGTTGSTFSGYIERQLHPVYTNKTVSVPSPLKRNKGTHRS